MDSTNDSKKTADLLGFAKKALTGHIQDLEERCRMLKQICLIYCVILFFILALAGLKTFYPAVVAPLLSQNMGIISIACFVSIQISFELGTGSTKQRPLLVWLKAFFYILDLSIIINSKAPVMLTVIGCFFAGLQLLFMYITLSKEQSRVRAGKTKSAENLSVALSRTQISLLIIAVNFVALTAGIAMGIARLGIDSDAILMIILGALVVYYVQMLIKTKTEDLLDKNRSLQNVSVVELAFKVLKPVGAALFRDIKKFKFA